ncbi:protein phosphatase 2C domain-containing protein [Besnoitia besnoiti]|uniref:Protein phosphatase 2C domain-containing protein n=1 Tax=Besnoitia besnoiti TaxID=94643 RepID=A0A2A9MMH9_BESBE|nr:protein phosphatase 2C domain-containing protein [Besnoitia besnoiti]PFH36977.1 protein phosphatase 2C domain-containing protein [Besnoitia besnoiti]
MGFLPAEARRVPQGVPVASSPAAQNGRPTDTRNPGVSAGSPLPVVICGIGWSEDQGARPDMEDGMLVIADIAGVAHAWLLAIYDGHGGRQTVSALLDKLHVNVLRHLRSRAGARWQVCQQRASARIRDIQRRMQQLSSDQQRALTDLSVPMPSPESLLGLLRLNCIFQWLLQCGDPTAQGTGVDPERAPFAAPSFLTICSDEDVHAALNDAFIQTDHEILREQVVQSGATACLCLVRPVLRLERLLELNPEDLTEADWAVFSQVRHSADAVASAARAQAESQLVGMDVTVAHLGDSRAVLAYADGHADRLTHPSDHKASCDREVARVEELGGYVFGERVNGMLAIGRAFGDWSLKLPSETIQEIVQASSPTSRAFDRLRTMFGGSPTSAADHLESGGRRYVVSNEPDVRTQRLSGGAASCTKRSQMPASPRPSPSGQPALLILGCDGLFDVCSDQTVARLSLEFLHKLAAAHPDMTPSEAAEATARMLIEEAIGVRSSTDNVSVLVALLHPFGFSERVAALPCASPRRGVSLPTLQAGWLSQSAAPSMRSSLTEGVARHVFASKTPRTAAPEALARAALAADANTGVHETARADQVAAPSDCGQSVTPDLSASAGWAGGWLAKGLANTLHEASSRIASAIPY